jgi:hypothetical protein
MRKVWLGVALVLVSILTLILILRWSQRDGQPHPTANSRLQLTRTADGRPNLNGIWQAMNAAAWDIRDHHARNGVPGGQGIVEGNEIPYQEWAASRKVENFERRMTADPESRCYLPGVPRIMYMPFPFEIVQTPSHIVMAFEYMHAVRTIYLDGHDRQRDLAGFWMGDSRAHWEGDTLVVDVANFTDQTWFDRVGNFHSDALRLTERFTPVDASLIDYEVTVEDSKVFTRPWKMRMPLYRRAEQNAQLLEYECYSYLEDELLESAEGKGRVRSDSPARAR